MPDLVTIIIIAVFALAGMVKGVIGLGLPTIAMGLLAVVMTPVEAAAILVLPSLLTNLWQMVSGPSLKRVFLRLWPMMVGVCLGTWAGAGLMTGAVARYGTALLGVALLVYAIMGLASMRLSTPRAYEPWLVPVIGAVTGGISAATGVFVIPAVPYLQSIGLEGEEMVQALGLSFTVSTVALAFNLGSTGAFNLAVAGSTLVALAAACVGMWVGQMLRRRLHAAVFRRCFFAGLLLLGFYLLARSVV